MYRNISSAVSAVLWVLLPKCSVCLMAYTGIFSALGLGSVVHSRLALPLITGLLAINLLSVICLSLLKKEYGYALLSLVGAIVLTVNRLYLGSLTVNIITGMVLLVAMLRIRLLRTQSKTCIFNVAGSSRLPSSSC